MNTFNALKIHLPERDKSDRRFEMRRLCASALCHFAALIHRDTVPVFVLCSPARTSIGRRTVDDGASTGIRSKYVANTSQVCYVFANQLSAIGINVNVAMSQTS